MITENQSGRILIYSLSIIEGTYSGEAITSAGTEFAMLTVSSSGAISGSGASGCSFVGSASPRASGNVYDLSVTFQGGVCVNGTSTLTGIGDFTSSTSTMAAVALNASRSDGFVFFGVKQ
jgi:hypothetical protein